MKKLLMLAWLSVSVMQAQQMDVSQGAEQEAESALGMGQGSEQEAKAMLGVRAPKRPRLVPHPINVEASMEARQIKQMFKEPKPGFWHMTGLLPGELAFIKKQEEGAKNERRERRPGKSENAVYGTIERVKGEAAGAERKWVAGAQNIERKVGVTEAKIFNVKEPQRQGHQHLGQMVEGIASRPMPAKSEPLGREEDAKLLNGESVPGVTWKRTSQSSGVPAAAIRGGFHQSMFEGNEMLLSSFICRVKKNNTWDVGTLLDNGNCLVLRDGREFSYDQYQALQGAAGQLLWKPKGDDKHSIETGSEQLICHALIQQNIPHGKDSMETVRDVYIGKVINDVCEFGFNGKKDSTAFYEVLTKK